MVGAILVTMFAMSGLAAQSASAATLDFEAGGHVLSVGAPIEGSISNFYFHTETAPVYCLGSTYAGSLLTNGTGKDEILTSAFNWNECTKGESPELISGSVFGGSHWTLQFKPTGVFAGADEKTVKFKLEFGERDDCRYHTGKLSSAFPINPSPTELTKPLTFEMRVNMRLEADSGKDCGHNGGGPNDDVYSVLSEGNPVYAYIAPKK